MIIDGECIPPDLDIMNTLLGYTGDIRLWRMNKHLEMEEKKRCHKFMGKVYCYCKKD